MARRAPLTPPAVDGRSEQGFTLVELMVAAMVLVIGILGTLTLLDTANARIQTTRSREAATNLAREIAEAARTVPYPSLDTDPTTLQATLQQQPGLADTSSATPGWQLVRRGTTFTVEASACVWDDPGDGVGDHSALGTMCAGSSASGTADVNADDYRRLTIDVHWKARSSHVIHVLQTALINNPGSAFAPTVRTLAPNVSPPPTGTYTVTSMSTASVPFIATISPRAAYADWSQDNIVKGSATAGTGSTWTFNWPTPSTLGDGVYLIGLQGFNTNDQAGALKTIAVRINRQVPAAPAGFAGGGNNGGNGDFGLEFEWKASPDGDVTGYRVYQMVGAAPATTDPVICSTSASATNPTSCVVPGQSAATGRYYVVARAPACCGNAGTDESARPTAANTVAVGPNVQPNPPLNLSLSYSNGMEQLAWSDPVSPAAGEASDSVRYFRIYKDGLALGNRYDKVDPTQHSWVDQGADGLQHTYYVVTVDSHLKESTPAGGVTG